MVHRFGRFSFELASGWKFVRQAHEVSFLEVEELSWPAGLEWRAAALGVWQDRLNEIRSLPTPIDLDKVIIQTGNYASAEAGPFANVLYYDDEADEEMGRWQVLCAYPEGGLWLSSRGYLESKGELLQEIQEMAKHYRATKPANEIATGYHLTRGLLATPYADQEEMFVAFANGEVSLDIETEAVDEPSDVGLMERLEGTIATNFGSGVKVKTLRKGRRTVAGMAGEEILTRLGRDDKGSLSFMFLFNGEEDSGDEPRFTIELEAPDSQETDMIPFWDGFLDSIKSLRRG